MQARSLYFKMKHGQVAQYVFHSRTRDLICKT